MNLYIAVKQWKDGNIAGIINRDMLIETHFTSLDDAENGINFSVYPNPTRDFLNVCVNTYTGAMTLVLYDMSGREVLRERITSCQMSIGVGDFPSGIYLMELWNDSSPSTKKKFVKN